MFQRTVLSLLVGLFLAGTASALTLDPLPGWVTAAQLDKAVEVAKKKDCPIVLLYAPLEGGADVVRARVYMRDEELAGMVRVLIYESTRPPAILQRVASQVETGEGLPVLYLATPELKILGFVQHGGHKKSVGRVAELATKTMAWIKKSRSDITAADKGMEAGRFGTALKTFKRISEDDKKTAVLVYMTRSVQKTPDDFETFYFPEIPGKITEVSTQAEARLQKAKEAFAKKDYEEARKLLFPMVVDKCDLEPVSQAAELFRQVEAAMKEKK